ncbi:Transposase MuDR plant [Arabidopsis thaliana x Arabidopsis arenosa]|uniref:Transposase MuDR plant n=1 Tax=Arabidopsis thaliana x Arabidopsis arenosa TaxID=1240361 RepID=A0A8T1Y892_9BRAS|nr:Transposase MuDR plant [Arabidopsis thaliana x Arabidopsis arenosa]
MVDSMEDECGGDRLQVAILLFVCTIIRGGKRFNSIHPFVLKIVNDLEEDIISILQPSAAEEALLLDIMERGKVENSLDPIVGAWNERLDVQKKKICWEDLHKEDVDYRGYGEGHVPAAEHMEEPQQNVPAAKHMEEELLAPYMVTRMVKTAVVDAMKDVYLRFENLGKAAEASKAKGKDGEEEETSEKTDDLRTDWETIGGSDYRGDGEESLEKGGEEPAVGEKKMNRRMKMCLKKKYDLPQKRRLKPSIHVTEPFTEEKGKKEKKKKKEKEKENEKEKARELEQEKAREQEKIVKKEENRAMASYYMAKEDFYSYESDLSHGGDENLVGEDGDYGVQPWYGDDYASSEYEDDPGGEEGEPEPPDRCPTSQHHTEPQTATTTSIQANPYVYEDDCEPEGDSYVGYQYHFPKRKENTSHHGVATYRVQTRSTPAIPKKRSNKVCDYTSNSLIFTGTSKDPEVYLSWENNMKQWLRSNNIPKEEKLYYALSKLKGDAYKWWLREDAATYYTTKAVLDWGTLKSRMYRDFTKKYQPRIRTTKPLYMEMPKKVVTTPKLPPIFQPMNAHSHEPRRASSSTRKTPIKSEQFVQVKEVQQDSPGTPLHELQGKVNRGSSNTMEKTAVLISQETTSCDSDSQAPHQSYITIQEDKTPALKQETNSNLIGNQGTKDDHKGDSSKSKEFMDQNENREEYTPLLIKRAANGNENFNETIQIKEKPPDEKPLEPIRGKILHPHILQWTNLTYLCVGDQVLRTKILEEGGYDAVINPRTNHGEDYGRETTTQEQPSGIFNQVLSKTSGQTRFSLPEKTPEPCSVQTKSKIMSYVPANTWNTFSAQIPSISKKNQTKRSSHERVIQFTSRMIPSLPDLDIHGVIGGFRPEKKDLSYEGNQGQEQPCGREDRGSVGCASNEELISSSRETDENMTLDERESSQRDEVVENRQARDDNIILYEERSEERAVVDNSDVCEGAEATPVVKREWEDGMNVTIRQEFENKQAVKDLVDKTAHKNCFEFIIVKSDTMLFVVKYSEVDKGCKWSLRAAKDGNSDSFSVRTYNKIHTCLRSETSTMRNKRRGTQHLVASVLREDFPCLIDTPTPKNLIPLVQLRAGLKVSYSTANRGKKLAAYDLRGTPDDSYKMVYSYMHMLENMNQGTVSYVELDEDKRFKYLFFALGACIEGFKAMRKVIIVVDVGFTLDCL